MVVVGITSLIAGILLPAIQASREASRRSKCANNLRQVGLALQRHADARRALPEGVAGNGTYGFSWWVGLLPFLEESNPYDQLDRLGSHCGSPALHAGNGRVVHHLSLDFMLCPSSPIPPFWPTGAVETLMPSYVGISGATSHDGFDEQRVETCCIPRNDGEISAGGALIPNRSIHLREITDGQSRTIIVGECSNFMSASNGLQRVDGGFHQGWLTGTFMVGTPPKFATTFAPRPSNLTTIRYQPNFGYYDSPGILSVHGINNPLLSAHPGGVFVLFVDGSTQFMQDDVAIRTLKSLATRDDGELYSP